MAVTSASLNRAGAERAIAIFTAFCTSPAADKEEVTEALFDIVDEIAATIRKAVTPQEQVEATRALARTFLTMAGIMEALLIDCAQTYDLDVFTLLSGLAQELYRSIA